ncbi:alpha/beta-hydrolase [Ceraceosorus guamensis]|uniref:Alpha/beta-hydrolase n=1 Tax=Ceraceosorus guamensis TaxID=1522189 RepID=A0A316W331_9BASI|nr:alpha/beta-hydrolase [Ceraceosorus guamensis]PWN43914.1 alpha/beta-hydrolase [Ceraceosorus guamensis]
MRFAHIILAIAAPLAILAAPVLERDPTPTTASVSELSSFIAPAKFARDSYCPSVKAGSKVGDDGQVLWATGDGRKTQRVYVAYSKSQGIVVAHQGTNTSSLSSLLNDANFIRDDLDSRLSFLGADASVVGGFQDAWLDTADQVLSQVKSALSKYPGSQISIFGHSLGASIGLLDAAFIKHNLPSSNVKVILFGLPRSGNDEFASAIDNLLPGQKHVTHYRDPIPHLPGETLGYQAPSGEVWLNEAATTAVDCPGQENDACSNSVHFYQYDEDDHDGPYYGNIVMKCDS